MNTSSMRGGTHIVETRLQRMLSKHSLFPALLLLLLAGGCAGPYVLRHSRPKYAEAVQVTRNEQLLLNLVRIRYRDTPSFLELSNLATQFSFDGGAGIAGTIKENSKNFNVLGLSAGMDASERPTASYTPLQGADFVTKLISPIEEESIVLLTRSGWKGERVFRIAVQSLNGLSNMRRASGPTPVKITQTEIKEATDFRKLVQNLEEQSQGKVLRFNYEAVEVPKSTAIPISTLTPEHAVQAAQHGFKIIHKHQRISIDIDKIKLVSPEANSYIDDHLLDNLVKSVEKDGLPRPIRVKFDPDTEPLPRPELLKLPDPELLRRTAEKNLPVVAGASSSSTAAGSHSHGIIPTAARHTERRWSVSSGVVTTGHDPCKASVTLPPSARGRVSAVVISRPHSGMPRPIATPFRMSSCHLAR